jgi:hypothetical protein
MAPDQPGTKHRSTFHHGGVVRCVTRRLFVGSQGFIKPSGGLCFFSPLGCMTGALRVRANHLAQLLGGAKGLSRNLGAKQEDRQKE